VPSIIITIGRVPSIIITIGLVTSINYNYGHSPAENFFIKLNFFLLDRRAIIYITCVGHYAARTAGVGTERGPGDRASSGKGLLLPPAR